MTQDSRTALPRIARIVGLGLGLAFWMLAVAVAQDASAAPAATFTATPLQGAVCVEPCVVHFDSLGTDDPDYSREFHTMLYRWNFGDAAAATRTWWHSAETGLSRDQDFGPIVGHVYESPGTYTATLEVTAPDQERSTVTRSVTVANPNTVFASNTWCFSTGSNFAGCPNDRNADGDCADAGDVNQCVTLGANQFDEALKNDAAASPRGCNADASKSRCLFKGGDNFSSNSIVDLYKSASPGLIGSFGTGRANVAASYSTQFELNRGWQITGLSFSCGTTDDCGIFQREWPTLPIENAGIHNVSITGRVSNCATGFAMGSMQLNRDVWFTSNTCTKTGTTSVGTQFIFLTGNHNVILGNDADSNTFGMQQLTVRALVTNSAISHNSFRGPGSATDQRGVFQLRADGTPGAIRAPNQRNEVAYNQMAVTYGPPGAGVDWTKICSHHSGCNSTTAEGAECNDIIYENNFHLVEGTPNTSVGQSVQVQCADTTIRNNVFDLQGQQGLPGDTALVGLWGLPAGVPADDRIQVYNNTVYMPGPEADDFRACVNNDNAGTGHECRNNLVYLPGQTGTRAASYGSGWTTTTNNDIRTSPNPFPATPAGQQSTDFGDFLPASAAACSATGNTAPGAAASCIRTSGSVTVVVCGNGLLQAGEACDDGNTVSGDGCSSTCTVEVAVCGNGIRQGAEGCDDGNTVSWDGCSATCTVEVPVCGNGHRQGTEACDDGNTVSGDGCSSACTVEVAVCGNGVRQGAEGCDDGNTVSWDGCSATCAVEVPVCGNGHRQGTEACDDGNTVAWDGCSATCTVEVPVCGNGHLQGTEACDDGNTASGDGCSSTCTVEVAVCGNGIQQMGEGCDDGNVVGGDGCSSGCVVESNPDAPLEYLINAGGGSFTGPSAKVWSSDASFATGGRVAYNNVPIALTTNDQLYQSRRYGQAGGPPLVLEFPVAGIGPFRVRLHFAELDAAAAQPGRRVFNVVAEGVVSIPDVDVFASGGFQRAYSRIAYVNVDDGMLTLSFEPIAGEPMISGVEIIEQEPQTSAPEFVDPCVEFPENCQ